MFLKNGLLACFVSLLCVSGSFGAFDLQITEAWPGNEPGSSITPDWFEVTNSGDLPWVADLDGDLWFDDDSADPIAADLLMGVEMIAPGESVVFVDGDDGSGANVTEFLNAWDPVKPQGQVGSYEGSGLSQGGDAISIWITPGLPAGEPDLFAMYPDADFNGGQSFDFLLDAFSEDGNASDAVTTVVVNDAGQPGVGSPGTVVPEPTSAMLLLLCLSGFAIQRK